MQEIADSMQLKHVALQFETKLCAYMALGFLFSLAIANKEKGVY